MKFKLRLCVLLSALLLLCTLPAIPAQAASGNCGTGLKWNLSSGTLTISGEGSLDENFNYKSSSASIKKVVIKSGVTYIGEKAFQNFYNITSVTIPSSVYYIGAYAFAGCSKITNLALPEGVRTIADHAFDGCYGLTSVTIPNSVTSIGSYAFYCCTGLTTVTILDSVTSIGYNAFYGCQNLSSLTMGNNIRSIGEGAFCQCSLSGTIQIPAKVSSIGSNAFAQNASLTAIQVANGNTYYYSDASGVLLKKDHTQLVWAPPSLQGNYEIPNGVKAIPDYCFYKCANLSSVTIPGSVTSIGNWAFYRSGLASVVINEGVASIGEGAFGRCFALSSVTIPNSVTSIGSSAFEYSSITSVVLPNSITTINSYTFHGCSSLTSITIPSGVTYIQLSAFNDCSNLKSMYFLGDAPTITGGATGAFSSCNFTAYYPACNTSWTEYELQDYGGDITWVPLNEGKHSYEDGICVYCGAKEITTIGGTCGDNLTWTLDDNGTLTISGTGEMYHYDEDAPWLGYQNSITTLVVEEGVTSIGSYAFWRCSKLANASIADSVQSFGYRAFSGCTSLTEIAIPETQTSIWSYTFSGCSSLTSIVIPSSVQEIEEGAFGGAGLTSVVIPDSVTKIGNRAFDGCTKLTEVYIGKNVSSLYARAFAYCSSLESVWFTGRAPSCAETNAFVYSPCKAYYPNTWTVDPSTTIDRDATWIPYDLCENGHSYEDGVCTVCGAEENPTIGGSCGENATWTLDADGTLTISGRGDMASSPFSEHLADIKNVVIENGITSIGNNAFDGCSNLTSIEIPDSVAIIRQDAFSGCSSLSSIEIPDGVTSIDNGAFKNCSSLTSVAIPDGVLSLEYDVFSGCSFLTSIEIPNSVTSIRDNALSGCGFLTSIEIPDGVTYIGDGAFSGCANLISIDIPDGVTSIGNSLFAGCLNLSSVVIPDSVTSIGSQAFTGCSKLTSVKIPEGLTSIGNYAFSKCSSLTSIDIPGSVTSIGKYTFSGCSSLGSVTFQGSAPSLASDAFDGVGMFTANYPSNLPGWDEAINSNYGAESITWEPYTLLIDLEGATMTLSNSLSMNFVVDADYLVGDGHYAVITRTYADDTTDTVTCQRSDWVSYDGKENQWYFTYENIAAKEMTDVLTVMIYDAEGNKVSSLWTDSPRDYCMRAIRDEEALTEPNREKLAMYVDMLNYGAAAQDYFDDYHIDDLATSQLSNTQKAYATTDDITVVDRQNSTSGSYLGNSLTLVKEIRLNFGFNTDTVTRDMKAVATYTDHGGKSHTITIQGSDFMSQGEGILLVSVTGMAVADYDQPVTCTVFSGETEIASATDSVASYIGRATKQNDHPLFTMILKFGYSAYNVFH